MSQPSVQSVVWRVERSLDEEEKMGVDIKSVKERLIEKWGEN